MAERVFEIRTEPHKAVIGSVTILFEPEVVGAVFAQSYNKLRAAQEKVSAAKGSKANSSKSAKAENVSPELMAELSKTMLEFVTGFVLPESEADFNKLRLPDRVLVQLMEWTAELYGGGGGNPSDRGGSSSDSA